MSSVRARASVERSTDRPGCFGPAGRAAPEVIPLRALETAPRGGLSARDHRASGCNEMGPAQRAGPEDQSLCASRWMSLIVPLPRRGVRGVGCGDRRSLIHWRHGPLAPSQLREWRTSPRKSSPKWVGKNRLRSVRGTRSASLSGRRGVGTRPRETPKYFPRRRG